MTEDVEVLAYVLVTGFHDTNCIPVSWMLYVEKLTQQLIYAMTHLQEAEVRAQRAQHYAQEKYSEASIMPHWIELIENM